MKKASSPGAKNAGRCGIAHVRFLRYSSRAVLCAAQDLLTGAVDLLDILLRFTRKISQKGLAEWGPAHSSPFSRNGENGRGCLVSARNGGQVFVIPGLARLSMLSIGPDCGLQPAMADRRRTIP